MGQIMSVMRVINRIEYHPDEPGVQRGSDVRRDEQGLGGPALLAPLQVAEQGNHDTPLSDAPEQSESGRCRRSYYQARPKALFRGSAPADTIPLFASDKIAALLPME